MADTFTKTTRNSYGSRVGNSFKSILGGIVLIFGAIWLLARNENNYVEQKEALNETEQNLYEADAQNINSELDNQAIHVIGKTSSPAEDLTDEIFGVKTNGLKLYRTVEMYQWKEDSETTYDDNYGGSQTETTTYTYSKVWDEDPIDSSYFEKKEGHENPINRKYTSEEHVKDPILLGAYTLTDTFIGKLNNKKAISLTDQSINTGEQDENTFHVYDTYIYIGKDSSSPEIGDLRITFSTVNPGEVSIIGKQDGNTIVSYIAKNKKRIALLEQGHVDSEEMFLNAHNNNALMTWCLRALGLLLLYFGFTAIFSFISTIAKIIPPLASILEFGTNIVAFILAIVVGLLTIAIARLAVRPIVGISILIIGAALIYGIVYRKKNKSAIEPAVEQHKEPHKENDENSTDKETIIEA